MDCASELNIIGLWNGLSPVKWCMCWGHFYFYLYIKAKISVTVNCSMIPSSNWYAQWEGIAMVLDQMLTAMVVTTSLQIAISWRSCYFLRKVLHTKTIELSDYYQSFWCLDFGYRIGIQYLLLDTMAFETPEVATEGRK